MDLFSKGHYDEAINIFLELDTNPAKVVALYPEVVSGRMCVPSDEWIPLFGGKKKQALRKSASVDSQSPSVAATGAEGSTAEVATQEGGVVSAESTTASSSDDTASASTTEATATVVEVTASISPATQGQYFGAAAQLNIHYRISHL